MAQQLWGVRSIHDAVMRRADNNADSDYTDGGDRTWHYLTDAAASVVAVIRDNGDLVERVGYTPYGVARHQWAADVDGDGAVTTGGSSDLSIANAALNELIDDAGYNVDADIDRDGDVDTNDTALITVKAALVGGLISDPAGADSEVGFQAMAFNAGDLSYAGGLRLYAPDRGRWLERSDAAPQPGAGAYSQAVQGQEFTPGSGPLPHDGRQCFLNPACLSAERIPLAPPPPPDGPLPPGPENEHVKILDCPAAVDLSGGAVHILRASRQRYDEFGGEFVLVFDGDLYWEVRVPGEDFIQVVNFEEDYRFGFIPIAFTNGQLVVITVAWETHEGISRDSCAFPIK